MLEAFSFFLMKTYKKVKIWFLFFGTKLFFCVQECSSHNLQWLSVQTPLHTVLYANAVVSFPSVVIDDTQGLTFSVREKIGKGLFFFLGWPSQKHLTEIPLWFLSSERQNTNLLGEKEGKKPISGSPDISWWYQRHNVTGKTTQGDSDRFLWLHYHCAFYS